MHYHKSNALFTSKQLSKTQTNCPTDKETAVHYSESAVLFTNKRLCKTKIECRIQNCSPFYLFADVESKEARDEQVNPYWIDHHPEMKKGVVDFLSSNEEQFWKDLIDKYLYVLEKDEQASATMPVLCFLH
jgi:chitin synthase